MPALEAIVTVLLDSLAIAAMLLATTAGAASWRRLEEGFARLSARRQVEQLVDASADGFLSVPPRCPRQLSVSAGALQILADLDADGSIDRRSLENTAFELDRSGGQAVQLRHRIGRQRGRLLDNLPAGSRLGAEENRKGDAVLVTVPLDAGVLSIGFEREAAEVP